MSARTPQGYEVLFTRVMEVWGRNIALEQIGKDELEKLRDERNKTHSPITLGNRNQRIGTLFNWT